MTHPILKLAAVLALFALGAAPAGAHNGALDANGCHYDHSNGQYHCHKDVPPNPDRNAPVKKSRDNICHDVHSPNYKTLKYFISFRSMAQCVSSGGREAL